MTKNQELEALRQLVATLREGPSYTGEWLHNQMAVIEAAVRSDMPVETRAYSWSEYCEQGKANARSIEHAAREKAERLLATSKARSREILKAAATACANAEREFDTMRQRLAELRQQAGFLSDNVNDVTLD